MGVDSEASQTGVAVSPSERISICPKPAWASEYTYDAGFRGNPGDHLTRLLESSQVHGESKEFCVQTAYRLETMDAVQHLAQWRIQFQPATQQVKIHWIRVRRGEILIEQASMGGFRLLQREEGLERFVLEGWFTVLLLLEDIRPGDIIESAYTIEGRSRLLPDNFFAGFGLPPEAPVGTYHFSARFSGLRAMKWKSSSPDLAPSQALEHGEQYWAWSGTNYRGRKRETYTPAWYVPSPWVQISDCSDWQTVAAAVADAWNEQPADPSVAQIAQEIMATESDAARRATKAINLIQNEYRYLSVTLELGGHVPAQPETVIRRRFGDCKDLSFLLVHLLRSLGIPARPILVDGIHGRIVGESLPMPNAFNHAVVEYELQGRTHWVDPTMKRQGGGALDRFIPDFGFGLPVDRTASGLVPSPPASSAPGLYQVKESFLLDTAGDYSSLAVVLTARGRHADELRQQFETHSVDVISKERLQVCANRYRYARRIGAMQFRDNRELNEFHIAEVFEIKGFLQADRPGFCTFHFPINLVVEILPLPDADRQTLIALPHPGHFVHIIEVTAPLPQLPRTRGGGVDNPFVNFTREVQTMHRFWGLSLTLKTVMDSVPVGKLEEYRKAVLAIRERSMWRITVPVGHSQPMRRSDFGALPREAQPLSQTASGPAVVPAQAANTVKERETRSGSAAVSHSGSPAESSLDVRKVARPQVPKSDWSKRSQGRRMKWSWGKKCLVGAALLWVLFLLAAFISKIFSK